MNEKNRSVTFQVNHLKMDCGIYLPMINTIHDAAIKTFDIRVCKPYTDPVLNEGVSHTIEHMLATGLRAIDDAKIEVIYFGPMGCMTGFYLLLAGNFTDMEAIDFILRGVQNALAMREVPANNKIQCGNCLTLQPVEKVHDVLIKIKSMCEQIRQDGILSQYQYL